MVDERGRDKNQICNGERMAKNEMWDNYRFILLVRASHFRSLSKTVYIPEDLGCRCDRSTCRCRRGILDCHTPFREIGNEASIRVPRMFKSHAWQQYDKQMQCY
jgi:hypothetical protein